MNNYLVYQENSNTIRQEPGNYCIAIKKEKRWILDFDIAADPKLIKRVMFALLDHSVRYGDGFNLLMASTSKEQKNSLKSVLNEVSLENDWNNFKDVVFNAINRKTIYDIVETAIEIYE